LGAAINYARLPNVVTDWIVPIHFGFPLTEETKARMLKAASYYSKVCLLAGTACKQTRSYVADAVVIRSARKPARSLKETQRPSSSWQRARWQQQHKPT